MKWNALFLLVVICITGSILEEVTCEVRQGWRRKDRVVPLARDLLRQGSRVRKERMHTVIIAVRQLNLDALERRVHDISNPSHPEYGNYLSSQEVGMWIRNEEGTARVASYLRGLGSNVRIKTTLYGEYFSVTAPISLWESVLSTEFHEYHRASGKVVVGAEEYSLPDELFDVVDAVFNVCDIEPPPVTHLKFQPVSEMVPESSSSSSSSFFGGIRPQDEPIVGFATTDSYVRPSLISSYYNIRNNTGSMSATQAVFATIGQTMSPSDLSIFQSSFGLPIQPISANINGHVDDDACTNDMGNCVEANLDVQYMMSTGQNVHTTFYYTDLSWAAWATEVANMADPPRVISISYGSDERFMSAASKNNFNTQAIRLAAMGVTLVVATGDDGALGFNFNSGATRICGYFPSFPASNPYVLAVGATMGPESGKAEIHCSSRNGSLITGGGGFSAFYARPSYQNIVVASWTASLTQAPTAGYNTNGRGFPDISLLGNRYLVVLDGTKYYVVSGTSASAPVIGGMLALINSKRKEMGMSEVGWINPALYTSYPAFVRDVTEGDNKCTSSMRCCSHGFQSAVGWDPVTGFGSLDFEAFFATFTTPLNTPSLSPSPTLAPTSTALLDTTTAPSIAPTTAPPSRSPSKLPTADPTLSPSNRPSVAPTLYPSLLPSAPPTVAPSTTPTNFPTHLPSREPTMSSTTSPSLAPTVSPSDTPTEIPSMLPTEIPSMLPSSSPVEMLISWPSVSPSLFPSMGPTMVPSQRPTRNPTSIPTALPSAASSPTPTQLPTPNPASASPSHYPTASPVPLPPSNEPSPVPLVSPTKAPSQSPIAVLTSSPTLKPTALPTRMPTLSPSTAVLSNSLQPSSEPVEISCQPTSTMPLVMMPSAETVTRLQLSVQYSLSNVNVESLADAAAIASVDQTLIQSTCSSLALPTSYCFCSGTCLRLAAASNVRAKRSQSGSTVEAFVNVSAPFALFDDGTTSPEEALSRISASVASTNTTSLLTALVELDSLAFGGASMSSPSVSSSYVETIPESASPTQSPAVSPSSALGLGLSGTVFVAVVAGGGGVLLLCLVAVVVACLSRRCTSRSLPTVTAPTRSKSFDKHFISDHNSTSSVALEFGEEEMPYPVCRAHQLSV